MKIPALKPQQQAEQDQYWMERCLELARGALPDVPIAAIVIKDSALVAQAINRREEWNDPIAHAEILVLQEASKQLGRWRLNDCTLYVNLEPCCMCAGAMVNARLGRIVFAAHDPKAGAAGSVFQILQSDELNHKVECVSGVLAETASNELKSFFKTLRESKKEIKKANN